MQYENVQIEVVAQGKGPLIVLLPSLGRTAVDYDTVAKELVQEGFKVLRSTPRGIGDARPGGLCPGGLFQGCTSSRNQSVGISRPIFRASAAL